MKNYVFFIISLCCLTAFVSCQDEDFGFSKEDLRASVYEREFIKTFGKPAANHQWGFDAKPFEDIPEPEFEEGPVSTRATGDFIGEDDRYRRKIDQDWADNKRIPVFFELPPVISEKEHREVYYWFSHHKVNWKNEQPTDYTDTHSRDNDGWAHEIEGGPWDYGSLSDYAGDVKIGTYFEVNWSWIQNVASESQEDADEFIWDRETQTNVRPAEDTYGKNMSELRFRLATGPDTGKYMHMGSFNEGKGPGYPQKDITKWDNALFLLQCNFNDCIYQCTGGNGGSYHNKYIIVYLKGTGYEGWYLGMDYEANGASGTNQSVKANGICNDWIIKLTVPEAKVQTGDPVRIMCEDLGGVYDYDFNDIVVDITPKTSWGTKYFEIELKALGGTLPVYIAYDGTALWGTDDLHKKFDAVGKPVNVTTNTDNPAISSSTRLTYAIVEKNTGTDILNWLIQFFGGTGYHTADMDYRKLQIFIKPDSEAEWIQLANYAGSTPLKICVPQTWKNKDNSLTEQAKSTKWTIECAGMPGTNISPKTQNEYEAAGKSMGCAYPNFIKWVNDPSVKFWKESNSTYLTN